MASEDEIELDASSVEITKKKKSTFSFTIRYKNVGYLEDKLKKQKRKLANGNEIPKKKRKKVEKQVEEEEQETNDDEEDDEIAEEDKVISNGKQNEMNKIIFIWICSGSMIPSGGNLTSVTFESLSERGVSDLTLKAISEMKLTTMTEIQAKSIGPLLEGR